jgi:TRAP-type C4-dicarboxylate transport system permease small subunit
LSQGAFTALVVVAVLCGLAAFAVVLWVSAVLAEPATAGVSAQTVGGMVAFGALVVACILVGYYAARRRPPRPAEPD